MKRRALSENKIKTHLLHILAWLLYASFIYITNKLTKPGATILNVLFYLLPLCLTFYVSVYCLNLHKEKGVWWSIASFFFVFVIIGAIGYAYIYFLLPSFGAVIYSSRDFKPFIQEALRDYVRIFSFALLYFYIKQSFTKEREIAALKQQEMKSMQEKLQYEYAFLRSQINPHFLHNTLNTLFSEALEYSPELADNILKLSSIMRYSLEAVEHESGKVSVQKELEQLQTLIDIHNLRFGNAKNINYTIEGNVTNQSAPPFSFITIVENAFKYGDLKDPEYPLTIRIVLKPSEVYFYCSNKIKSTGIQLSSSNIGISNLSKRLDVAFKDKYTMDVRKEDDLYIFELTIKTDNQHA
ncbi:MAG: sensor histidine kinase [Arachidicoccus sp.]|nr:sensor histidine kinase [Arachidicoccus sp.]